MWRTVLATSNCFSGWGPLAHAEKPMCPGGTATAGTDAVEASERRSRGRTPRGGAGWVTPAVVAALRGGRFRGAPRRVRRWS